MGRMERIGHWFCVYSLYPAAKQLLANRQNDCFHIRRRRAPGAFGFFLLDINF